MSEPVTVETEHQAPLLPTEADQTSTVFCTAVYDFPGEAEGDLPFKTGDRIEVLERIGEDWVKGQLGARSGMFPAAFVEFKDTGMSFFAKLSNNFICICVTLLRNGFQFQVISTSKISCFGV